MAQQRADIFSEAGMTDAEKRQLAEEEIKRKAKEREAMVWDGHIASAELSTQRFQTTANLDSQISAIHRAKGLTEDEQQTRIGPSQAAPPTTAPEPPAAFPASSAGGSTISAAPQANLYNPNARQMYNPYGVPLMQPGQTTLPAGVGGGFDPGAPPGAPAPPAQAPAGVARPAEDAPDGEPSAKRAKTNEPQFYDEQSWLETHPEPIALYVQMPEQGDRPEWDVKGQVIELSEVPLTALVSTLRERIHSQTQVPPGKQQLKWNDRILSNKNTLASYNFENGERLTLAIKKK